MKKSIRLPGYDYTQPGAYFITICTYQHQSLFGEISDGEIVFNELGRIANKTWKEIPNHFSNVITEYWIVMPNHIHGIIEIITDDRRDSACRIPTIEQYGKPVQGSIPTIVRSYKSAVTRQITLKFNPDFRIWQRNYYEHIIRNDIELGKVREYIRNNPLQWALDQLDPPDWDSI
ncbi:MAG: hypothetical protein JEZ00_00990 [Anaerolineaceae bacterium]|nr:hypothetical protein [Anaerolineaceae bacterium]